MINTSNPSVEPDQAQWGEEILEELARGFNAVPTD
jgi:hypothetical protein